VDRAALTFVGAFALHVLEEAPGFTAWARRHACERYTQRDFVRNNTLGLGITGAATYVLARSSRRRGGVFLVYYSTIFTQQALFNTIFHAGTTVAWRAYSPGLITSLTLFLPLWLRTTHLALDDGLITRRRAVLASALGGAIHAGAVAQQVFFIGGPKARGRS
jgi:uncharacterized protein with HXXEE motif